MAVTIDYDACDGNHTCAAVCPTDVFRVVDGVAQVSKPQACSVCLKCMEVCPEGAVTVDY